MGDETPPQPLDTVTFQEPPEGVIRGENVPVENDEESLIDGEIEEVMNALKATEEYGDWSESERRERAKQLIRNRNQMRE